MARKVLITDTILRDAHQSQAATRMRLDEMLPVLDQLDEIGYYSLEAWGGATFDSCMRYLNEDPWERLRILKKHLKKTPIQMLLRGQNLLGYKHYADDVVEKFVEASIRNGVSIVRVFDALNDPRNMETAMKAIKKYGGVCEAAICYTTSPVHTTEYFVKLAKQLEDMGADNICIKDMANILLPYTAYDLVKKMKAVLKPETKIHLHTHNTAGTGDMINLKAIEAGCDIVDTALSPLGNGTSQPATEPLIATLKGTEYDTGIDINKLLPITEHFRTVAERLTKDGFLSPKVLKVDINTLVYQVPGGMLSNLISQLKQQNKSDKLIEVLQEVPRVRKDFGYPSLVTPTSQIVGTQAVLNVLNGERYKMVTKESKGLLKGEYGKLPGTPDAEVVKKIVGNEQIITHRPADDIAPEYEKYRSELDPNFITQEEDVLSYALFNQVAINFFKNRMAKEKGVDKDLASSKDRVYPV
ncbi:MAG: pyruvate carboxylase subunit B [Christensenellaceae bacterium]|nr:pyruvate carboxylase subunit B [Christensenellaceae bacterium]MDD6927478.1 pyruvate carboxylase subunit B [bacterium]